MKRIIPFAIISVLLIFCTGAFCVHNPKNFTVSADSAGSSKKPEVYVGVADQYLDPLYNPDLWQYVRQKSDGLYANFIELGNWYNQSIVNNYASLYTNKNAYIESDMNATLSDEQGYIDKLQSAGFTIPYTSLNYGWDATRQANLKTYHLPSGQSSRLCFVQDGPWCIGGDITGNNGTGAFTNAQYRSWINQADGDSTDGPMGYWYTNQGQMQSGSYSMVNYAHSLGKQSVVMLCPYDCGVSSYNASMFLSTAESCVRAHEDHNAEPDVWSVFEYAITIDAVPEKDAGGMPHNSTIGAAYYLLKHLNGDPGTLDLSVTPDSGGTVGQYVYSPTVASTDQFVSLNASAAAGTVYHYAIKLTNSSSWCDYAGALKAAVSGSTSAWNVQFSLGGTNITGSVTGNGYEFYQSNRLNPLTSKTVDLYITRTSSSGDASLNLDLSLLPHMGSDTVDMMRVGTSSGSLPVPTAETPVSRSGWTASASNNISSDPAANAIDGSLTTRWTTGAAQAFGQWFQVDMGSVQSVNKIVFESDGPSLYDYAREYEVYLSADGVHWNSPVAKATGANDVISVTFPSTNARYFKIRQVGTDPNGHWWSINEVNAYWDGSAVVSTVLAPTSGVFEAEDALKENGALTERGHSGYSGSGFLEGFGNHAGASVTFTVGAQNAGTRDVTLKYSAGSTASSVSVYVNGVKVKIDLPANTANWDTWGYETDLLYLSAGNNTITYRVETAQPVNIDNITVANASQFEAESASLSGGAKVMTDHTGYTGTGFVAGFGENVGASATFTVNAATAGYADIIFRYSAGAGAMSIPVYVNGTKVCDASLPATANWNTWATKEIYVNLNSGNNAIMFRADSAGTLVNIDNLTA